ncbi:hypothetical protein [Curtobacterium flaccumfaciens]|uniref:hypothetical protein n=1 Tax=Curtobacterium flaccumfaciens TaxID=2035 RepID=UPI001BDED323|nr:hypothetical protein [Curtobacterium flaccumfaciens]MBT1631488.1 hypothetical protein [Curtobacterium flaccumfaciens pv. oortii]MCX2846796.1 hypothetical protein [Curtobacterium flaccumfaciens pv. oortii]
MPLSKVHRFGIVGIAILLAVLVLLFLVDISDGASTRTVLLAATMLAEAQFLVNVLRECEPRAWWMVSACAGLLPVGVVLAGALPDASAQVTVGLIFTVLTLVSFVAITIADAAGRFSTTWAWRATPEWRAAAVREVRSHTEARRTNRSQRP